MDEEEERVVVRLRGSEEEPAAISVSNIMVELMITAERSFKFFFLVVSCTYESILRRVLYEYTEELYDSHKVHEGEG